MSVHCTEVAQTCSLIITIYNMSARVVSGYTNSPIFYIYSRNNFQKASYIRRENQS